MASVLPESVKRVIEEFQKLPGVGLKSATRMAYHYIRSPHNDATKLAKALMEMDSSVTRCEKCFNVSEDSICPICRNPQRNSRKLCVVQEPLDVLAMEDARVYDGVYFVLGGLISPADGITAEELRFSQLKKRIEEFVKTDPDMSDPLEIILAISPSLEGEATVMYIKDMLADLLEKGLVVLSRIAVGLPTGADIEYADSLTLKKALEGRHSI